MLFWTWGVLKSDLSRLKSPTATQSGLPPCQPSASRSSQSCATSAHPASRSGSPVARLTARPSSARAAAALIDVDIARAQLKERLSTNERCGLNGLDTNLERWPSARSARRCRTIRRATRRLRTCRWLRLTLPYLRHAKVRIPSTVDARIKAEKLKQNEILTRKMGRARYGTYMDAAAARGEMTFIFHSPIGRDGVGPFPGCTLPDRASRGRLRPHSGSSFWRCASR